MSLEHANQLPEGPSVPQRRGGGDKHMQARHIKLHGGVLAVVIPPPAEPSVIPLSETGGACGSSLSVAMMRDGRDFCKSSEECVMWSGPGYVAD